MNYSDVADVFHTLRKKTGIHVQPHLFRHTHATLLYQQTKDIKLVQERLGHAQVQSTMNLYLHPSPDDIRNIWESSNEKFVLRRDT